MSFDPTWTFFTNSTDQTIVVSTPDLRVVRAWIVSVLAYFVMGV